MADGSPQYPVVSRVPDFGEVTGNFSAGDYTKFLGLTAVSAPFGYFVSRPVRGPGVVAGTFLGALGGFLLAYQSSSGRLMGYLPNESECAKAGIDYAPADGAPAN